MATWLCSAVTLILVLTGTPRLTRRRLRQSIATEPGLTAFDYLLALSIFTRSLNPELLLLSVPKQLRRSPADTWLMYLRLLVCWAGTIRLSVISWTMPALWTA